MKIISKQIPFDEIKQMAADRFGDLVKAVVDVERDWLAVDGELHSDLEALLLEEGSKQKDLWGINLYPELSPETFVEFDSLINLRPSQGNKSQGVEDPATRQKILEIVTRRIAR